MHSEEHPTSVPFWVRPDSNFGLFCNNDVYQQFRFLSHIIFACSLTVSVANSLAASSRLPLLLVLRKGCCVPFRFLMGITDHFVNGRRRRRYGGSSHLEDNQSSDLRVTQNALASIWSMARPGIHGTPFGLIIISLFGNFKSLFLQVHVIVCLTCGLGHAMIRA